MTFRDEFPGVGKLPRRRWIGSILALLAVWGCTRGDPRIDVKFSEEAEAEQTVRAGRIELELGRLPDHPWAGKYSLGDDLGVNQRLLLSPEAGFVFTWHGCLGLHDRNYGTVQADASSIRLVFALPNSREGFQGIAAELVPILWGERHYLVGRDEIVDFCNAVNAGDEPREGRDGDFLLRDDDWDRNVVGKPRLPVEYAPYLLSEPLQGKIAATGESTTKEGRAGIRFRTTTVTLNLGKSRGVRTGMKFHLLDESRNDARVIRVLDQESIAEVVDILSDDSPGPAPQAGVAVSTRPR